MRYPPQLAARLNALAKSKGIAAAEDAALDAEAGLGVAPWRATPTGLVAEDSRHLLLTGSRDVTRPPVLMYDPLTDELVAITKGKPGHVLVEIGPILLLDGLGDGKHALERDAVEHAITTYADGQGEVGASRWLVDHVKHAALREASRYGIDTPSYRQILPAKAGAIWSELEALSISQPWGPRRNPGGRGPRRRWVKT